MIVQNAEVKGKAIEVENTAFGFLVEDEVNTIKKQFMDADQAEAERRQAEAEARKPKKRWTAPPPIEVQLSKAAMGIPDDIVDTDSEDESNAPSTTRPEKLNIKPQVAAMNIAAKPVDDTTHTRPQKPIPVQSADEVVADAPEMAEVVEKAGVEVVKEDDVPDRPAWFHWRCTKADAETKLTADGGLEKPGHFLIRMLGDRERDTEYIVSVIFRGVCTHHKLDIGEEGALLNNSTLPEDVTSIETVHSLRVTTYVVLLYCCRQLNHCHRPLADTHNALRINHAGGGMVAA